MPLVPFGYGDNSLQSFRDLLPAHFLSHLMVLIEPLDQALKTHDVYCKASGMAGCLLLMPRPETVPSAPIWISGERDLEERFEVAARGVEYRNLDLKAAIEKTLHLVETCGAWSESFE